MRVVFFLVHPSTERAQTALLRCLDENKNSSDTWEFLSSSNRGLPSFTMKSVSATMVSSVSWATISLRNSAHKRREAKSQSSTIPPSGTRDGGDARASMMTRAMYMVYMELTPARVQ